MLAHEFVGALLPLSGKFAIGEMVAVGARMDSTVGSVEDSEGETRLASNMYLIGSEVCRRTNKVIVGVFDAENVCIPVASIC